MDDKEFLDKESSRETETVKKKKEEEWEFQSWKLQ